MLSLVLMKNAHLLFYFFCSCCCHFIFLVIEYSFFWDFFFSCNCNEWPYLMNALSAILMKSWNIENIKRINEIKVFTMIQLLLDILLPLKSESYLNYLKFVWRHLLWRSILSPISMFSFVKSNWNSFFPSSSFLLLFWMYRLIWYYVKYLYT